MFYEWVAHGAEIGVTAFFALFVFALCCGAVLGLVGIFSRIFKEDADTEHYRR